MQFSFIKFQHAALRNRTENSQTRMERKGHVPAIQGGGSGAGFNAPSSLIYDEPRLHATLVRRIIQHSAAIERECKSERSRELMSIWNSSLARRLFMLKCMREKKAANSGSASNTFTKEIRSSSIGGRNRKEGTPNLIEKNGNNAESKTEGAFINYATDTGRSLKNVSVVQIIPNMPKTIEKVAEIWRFGSEQSNYEPIRNFRLASFRKKHIDGYSDRGWKKGQKQLLQRYRSLVSIVLGCHDPPLRDDKGSDISDIEWERAILEFKIIWSSIPLTRVLRLGSRSSIPSSKEKDDPRLKALSSIENAVFNYHVNNSDLKLRIPSANATLKSSDLETLCNQNWLNDEIINSFTALINLRNKDHFKFHPSTTSTSHRLRPRTHVFNSFFYTCLTRSASEYDYAVVKNWPNRAGFTAEDMDLILIPINQNNKHWVLASIDLRTQTFSFMDPMKKERGIDYLRTLKQWLIQEIAAKSGEECAKKMNIDSWKLISNPAVIPKQRDGSSCGLFVLYMCDYMELGKQIAFTQSDVQVLRKRTVLYLCRNRLEEHSVQSREVNDVTF